MNNYIEQSLKLVNSIPADKIAHAYIGMLLFTALSMINFYIGLIVLVIVAVGKEVYDYYYQDKHTCDVYDAIATILGALPIIVIEIIKGIICH